MQKQPKGTLIKIIITGLFFIVNSAAFSQQSVWYVSYRGETPWTAIRSGNDLSFSELGDFNGDGKTDIIKHYDNVWQVSYGGTSDWVNINNTYSYGYAVIFKDFNGDKKTDAFYRPNNSHDWLLSDGATTDWVRINESEQELGNLAFGDFNGDGKTDVFNARNGLWYVSYSGTGLWTKINSSQIKLKDLRFADFNGDGKTDVFNARNGSWYVSYGGVGLWQKINDSRIEITSLGFADFDGDRKADIFNSRNGTWYVSYGGVGKWKKINESNVNYVQFGDFDGDGKADIFYNGAPPPPTAPTNLNSTLKDSTSITVTWRDNAVNEDGFKVSWVGTRTGYTDVTGSKTINGPNTNSYTITNCFKSTEYCIKVQAFNNGGKSAGTSQTCITTPTPSQNPPTPGGFAKIGIYNCHSQHKSVHLWTKDFSIANPVWTDNGVFASQYNSAGSCPSNAVPKTINLANGHIYQVIAISTDGDCNGNPDVANGSCRRLTSDRITGKTNGTTFILTVN